MSVLLFFMLIGFLGMLVAIGSEENSETQKIRQEIIKKKIKQLLPAILKRENVDLWIIFTREESFDPIAKDFAAGNAVARMAILLYFEKDNLVAKAIAASYDVTPLEEFGIYKEIISYKAEGIKPHLKEAIGKIRPNRIALNISRDIPIADGLSCGMRNYLLEVLGVEYEDKIISAEEIIVSFRSAKLSEEIEIIREGVKITEKIIAAALTSEAIKPGITTEKMLANFMKQMTKEMGAEVEFISINVGKTRGHADPTDLIINKGDLVRIDFGVRYKGYCTDLQRCAYILKDEEVDAPHEFKKMFEITKEANRQAAKMLRPGNKGIDVDTVARKVLIENGYEEYPHGTGHPIGLEVHDVGPMLGPDWKERYGSAVFKTIETGQTFAVEPLIYKYYQTYDGLVHVSLEEDVVITDNGAEYLSTPQEELIIIKPI